MITPPGKQYVVTGLAQQAPDIDREEIRGSKFIHMFANERLPRRIGSAHGRRLEAVTIQNSGDGAWTEGDWDAQLHL